MRLAIRFFLKRWDMARQIYALQEPNATIQKLHRAGLVQVRDILRLTADQLAAEAHLSTSEAASVLQRAGRRPALTSGRPRPPPGHVVTFSRRLDALLGGGLPLGRLTELVAPPGGGKTQLCLQACVDATLPAELGGLSAVSLYVDTEESPVAARLLSLASAAVDHCRRVALSGDEAARRAAAAFTPETALRRVRVLRAASAADLLLLPSVLAGLLERDGVRLVCVDSLAAPWRGAEAGPRRAQELQWLAGELRRLARRHAAAVVLTNHATTLLGPAGAAWLAPALGASWQHCAAVRLWLDVRGETRAARLLKHPDRPDGEAAFQILQVGIRDVCDAAEDVGDGDEESEEEEAVDAGDGHGEHETDPGASGEPGDGPAETADGGDVTGHGTKQQSGANNHVTKDCNDVMDSIQSKRRRVR